MRVARLVFGTLYKGSDRNFNGQYLRPKNLGFRYIPSSPRKHAPFMTDCDSEAISKCTIHEPLLFLPASEMQKASIGGKKRRQNLGMDMPKKPGRRKKVA
jgi:hypothetical protein